MFFLGHGVYTFSFVLEVTRRTQSQARIKPSIYDGCYFQNSNYYWCVSRKFYFYQESKN